jgi:HEAT repeat protein
VTQATAPSSLTLEKVRLYLIKNEAHLEQSRVKSSSLLPVLNEHAVEALSLPITDIAQYLLKALETADTVFSSEIETILTRFGSPILPELLKGLLSPVMQVRSTCAMVIIRIGPACSQDVLALYEHTERSQETRWVFELILQELRVSV